MTYNVIMYTLLDYLIENKLNSDWSKYFIRIKAMIADYDKADKEEWEKSKVPNTKPSFELKDYIGIYKSDVYGEVEISIKDNRLYLSMLHTSIYHGELTHWHFDTFSIKFEEAPSLPSGRSAGLCRQRNAAPG